MPVNVAVPLRRCAALGVLLIGCSVQTGGGAGFDGSGGSQVDGESGRRSTDDAAPGTELSGTNASNADPDDDASIKFDTPTGEEGGPSQGCTKVDFLFVVDNSSSMGDNQKNLVASFPGFISAIQETLQAQDYHIMVVDTDTWNQLPFPGFSINGSNIVCDPHPDCCLSLCGGQGTTCNDGPCPLPYPGPPTACDDVLGAARNINHYIDPCPIVGDHRYIVDGQPDLLDAFSCIAQTGLAGYWFEEPMGAMIAAISSELNAPGGCNDGFLRDEALLVVTIISDADEGTAPELEQGAQTWYDALVAAKNGDPKAVVLLGLFADGHLPGGKCSPNVYAPGYFELPPLFGDSGFSGSACEPDYSPFFLEAVSGIDAACDDFVPPG